MEWIKSKELLVVDEKVTCCDKGNKVMMICTSASCRQKQRLICMKCSIVHKDHMNELVNVKQFIQHSSERHDTTKRLQNYKEDLPSQPINYVDTIILNSILKQKQNFAQQMQDISQKISFGVKKSLGHLDAFGKSRENVMKLDKRKGATLETLSTEYLEMIIDLYWKQHADYDGESDVPEFVEEQIVKCSDNIASLLKDVFNMIQDEANKCLSRLKALIKENRIEQIKKQIDKEDRDTSPPHFPKPRKCADVQRRPISSKVFSKTAHVGDIDQKINEQQDLIKKDLEKLNNNKTNLFSENSNLQELNERHFQSLAERIQAKKSEIERMEKSKNIQNLKIARNQLNSLIREQVQNYKSFNAQQIRVDTRILEVLKNLEYKEEELQESKMMAQKIAIQNNLNKSRIALADFYPDAQSETVEDSPKEDNSNSYSNNSNNQRTHSYSINNISGYTGNNGNSYVRISTRKASSQVRNSSVTKNRPESPAPNSINNNNNKSFYSAGTSFQIGESGQYSFSDKKYNNNNLNSPLKQGIHFMNNNSYHLCGSTRTGLSESSPQKSNRPSTMLSSQERIAIVAFSPVKTVKHYT